MSKKVAIILSGCGAFDGSEIQETVCSLLAIEEGGFSWKAFSLNQNQKKVVSALTMEEVNETRNMMTESARITHGKIEEISKLDVSEFDILWLPGGYGMVSSFSDIEEKGENGIVVNEIASVIKSFNQKNKVIVGICIAPSVIAKSLESMQLTLTLGESEHFYSILEKLGHRPKKTTSEEFVFDKDHKVYSTPAYMNKNASCLKIYRSCKKIVDSINSNL